MVTTRPPKTIVKPTALGPVANTDTKLLIYSLFQKGRVLAQDGVHTQALQRFVLPQLRHRQVQQTLSLTGTRLQTPSIWWCQRRPKTAHSWRVKIAHPTIG